MGREIVKKLSLTSNLCDREAESERGERAALQGACEGRPQSAQDREHRAWKAVKSNIFFVLYFLLQRKHMNRIPRLINPLVRLLARVLTVCDALTANPLRSSKSDPFLVLSLPARSLRTPSRWLPLPPPSPSLRTLYVPSIPFPRRTAVFRPLPSRIGNQSLTPPRGRTPACTKPSPSPTPRFKLSSTRRPSVNFVVSSSSLPRI